MAQTDTLDFSSETTRAGALMAMLDAFRKAGIETPDRDARKLLAGVLGIDGIKLLTDPTVALAGAAAAVSSAARRRVVREPVSRILGQRDFFGHSFAIAPATLDPRPDSECVVSAAIAFLDDESTDRPLRVLDIGTGSGCLLLSILAACGNTTGVGIDIDNAALTIAATNARRLGLEDRVTWIHGAGLAPVSEAFNLIVANPPYIPSADIAALDAEVRLYDPPGALDGGADGLDVYRQILAELLPALPKGWILFEVGDTQAEPVTALIEAQLGPRHLADIRTFVDMGGVRRCVAARTQVSG